MAKKAIEKIVNGCNHIAFNVIGGKCFWAFYGEGFYVISKQEVSTDTSIFEKDGTYLLDSVDTKFAKKLLGKRPAIFKKDRNDKNVLAFDETEFSIHGSQNEPFAMGEECTFPEGKHLNAHDIMCIKHASEMTTKDTNKFFLLGVYLNHTDIVGCDGRELYLGKCSVDIDDPLWVHYKVAPFLNDEDCVVYKIADGDGHYVVFEYDNYYLWSIYPNLQYPNYPHVIPTENKDEDYRKVKFCKIPTEFKKWYYIYNKDEDKSLVVDNVDHLDSASKLVADFPLGKPNKTLGLGGQLLFPLNKILKNGEEILFHSGNVREGYNGKYNGPTSIKTNNDELIVIMPLSYGYHN